MAKKDKPGAVDKALTKVALRMFVGKTDVQGAKAEKELRGLIAEQSKKDKENPK